MSASLNDVAPKLKTTLKLVSVSLTTTNSSGHASSSTTDTSWSVTSTTTNNSGAADDAFGSEDDASDSGGATPHQPPATLSGSNALANLAVSLNATTASIAPSFHSDASPVSDASTPPTFTTGSNVVVVAVVCSVAVVAVSLIAITFLVLHRYRRYRQQETRRLRSMSAQTEFPFPAGTVDESSPDPALGDRETGMERRPASVASDSADSMLRMWTPGVQARSELSRIGRLVRSELYGELADTGSGTLSSASPV